jgi:hypothetical protein
MPVIDEKIETITKRLILSKSYFESEGDGIKMNLVVNDMTYRHSNMHITA